MEFDSRIWQKYIVYRDIRHRGYIIRVGFGGSADFRVFTRGAKFARDSAKYVYFIIQDGIPVALNELENVVNQVLGDRKNLILAIFDKLGDSTFYQLERFKFKKIKPSKEPEYKVSHDPYGGGYVVHTDKKHVEYFSDQREAYILRDKLNRGEE